MDENKMEQSLENMQPNAEATVWESMPVQPSPTPAPAPKTLEADPKKKKSGKKAAVITAVCAITLSCVLLVCMALGLFTPGQPWERTMEAVFPSFAMLEDMATSGGRVSLNVAIASDLSDKVEIEPLQLDVRAAMGRGGVTLSGSLGSKYNALDVGVVVDQSGAQLYSESLLGGGYSVVFEGLMDAIDHSIFAPDSGTDYALDEESYEDIRAFMEKLEAQDEDGMKFEETRAVLQRMVAEIKKTAQISHQDMTLSLIDANTKANVTIITLDTAALVAFKDVFVDQWENNTAFGEEVRDALQAYRTGSFGGETDEEVDIEETLDTFYRQFTASLDEYIELLEQSNFTVKITMATHAGYLVFFSMDARAEAETGNFGQTETVGVTFNWTFTSRPNRDASYDIVLVTYSGSERQKPLIVTYRQEKERFVFTLDTDTDDMTVKGTYHSGVGKYVLSVDSISCTSDGESVFEMTDSVFTLTLEKGNQKIRRVGSDRDLLTMSKEEMDALGERLKEEIIGFKEAVNDDLGFELIYDVVYKNTEELLSLDYGTLIRDYAYDEKSGHVFLSVLEYYTGRSYIEMYDLKTQKRLRRIEVDGPVAMDADNGYFVYGELQNGDFTVSIRDAETFREMDEISLKGMPNVTDDLLYGRDVYVDGDTLICLAGSWNCRMIFIDIPSQDIISMSPVYYKASIALNRGEHLVGIKDGSGEECRFAAYDSESGEHCFDSKKTYPSDGELLYFDGMSFVCFGYHFMADGQYYNTHSMILDRKIEDREATFGALVYKDGDILVTLEEDANSDVYTMFYELKGKKESAPVFEKPRQRYYDIRSIGKRAYIAIYFDFETYTYCVERFTIEDSMDIDF